MNRLAYNVKEIVNKLYSTIPLVPSNNLIQNIFQDIQYGLYDDCGDPNKNWDKWKDRCIELLKQRNILGQYRKIKCHNSNNKIIKKYTISRLKKIHSNKEYTWNEIVEITNNSGGRTYSSPFGDYSNFIFIEEIVDINNISGYIPYDECQELDLDEDMSVIEYLADRYDSGEILPPVILDDQYKVIDGSHRVSMYDYLNITKIKAFVLKK